VRRLVVLVLAVPGAACVALIALASLTLAAEPRRKIDVSRALDAGLPQVTPIGSISATPPDPPPLVDRHQWVFDLRWDRGDVWLLGVEPRDLGAPQATPRMMGRFAIELYEGPGPALVERVRFDFPMLGPPEADAGPETPSLTRQLKTRIGVLFPATALGKRLELVDRATGRRWALPWPPMPLVPPGTTLVPDGGSAVL
jgi:hypothetical protein